MEDPTNEPNSRRDAPAGVEPPKRLGSRLVGDARTRGDETGRIPEVAKPRRARADLLVHRRVDDFAKSDVVNHDGRRANAIVAGPKLLKQRAYARTR